MNSFLFKSNYYYSLMEENAFAIDEGITTLQFKPEFCSVEEN